MIFIDSDSQNLVQLITMIKEQLSDISQIRVWPILRDKLKEKYGDNAITILCLVPHLTKEDLYVPCHMFVSEIEYEDLSKHQSIMLKMKSIIDNYLIGGVIPKSAIEMISEIL